MLLERHGIHAGQCEPVLEFLIIGACLGAPTSWGTVVPLWAKAYPSHVLPALTEWGWGWGGVEDISSVRWGSHSGPRSPSYSEDLASGQGGFPISHSLLCFSAFLQTFPASVWFHLPFVPLRSQPPILVWETSMKPLSTLAVGFSSKNSTSCLSLPQIWGKMSTQCVLRYPLDPVFGN